MKWFLPSKSTDHHDSNEEDDSTDWSDDTNEDMTGQGSIITTTGRGVCLQATNGGWHGTRSYTKYCMCKLFVSISGHNPRIPTYMKWFHFSLVVILLSMKIWEAFLCVWYRLVHEAEQNHGCNTHTLLCQVPEKTLINSQEATQKCTPVFPSDRLVQYETMRLLIIEVLIVMSLMHQHLRTMSLMLSG